MELVVFQRLTPKVKVSIFINLTPLNLFPSISFIFQLLNPYQHESL